MRRADPNALFDLMGIWPTLKIASLTSKKTAAEPGSLRSRQVSSQFFVLGHRYCFAPRTGCTILAGFTPVRPLRS